MEQLPEVVRTEFRNLPLRELLHGPARVLLGVTPAAEIALKALEVNTVFDLATSKIFEGATKIVHAGTDLKSALYQHGAPTTDLVRAAIAAGKKIDELQFLPVGVLEAIPDAQVNNVQTALDVQTVRDLALYPPHRSAVAVLNTVYFPENEAGFDPERPTDLLPKTGEYPTERVQYTTLLMGEIPLGDEAIIDIVGPTFKPLDLAKLAAGDSGFKKVAFGALLTFNQSWYAQGVTLGQLLHSTSLAPGESTRIAVIDWSRKSRAGQSEVINEIDDLTSDTSHNRSISEVTQAVANEAQSGFSEANSNSVSTQQGGSVAAESSAFLGGFFGGSSSSGGGTSSVGTTNTRADGYSTSSGHRDIGSAMMQNVNDRTHQHAHSARSRRASVVKEVSQTEHEGVSTRVLVNYNHMHGLTIQYYEVVQIYRVEVAIVKADRVVFIPVQLVDFNNDAMVRRFQNVLIRAALTFEIREALKNLDVLEVSPERETHFTILGNRLSVVLSQALTTRTTLTAISIAHTMIPAAPVVAAAPAAAAAPPAAPAGITLAPAMKMINLADAIPIVQQLNDHLWSAEQTARLSSLLYRSVLRSDSNAIYLPTDVTVEGAVVSAGGTPMKIVFRTQHGESIDAVSPANSLAMIDVSGVGITGSSADRDVSATVILTINRNGVRFPLELPAVNVVKGTTTETRVVTIKPGGVNANLKQHLNDNRMHYSQSVFRSLDSSQIALLLSGYGVEVEGQVVPVAQVVEPLPVRYVGNYLAFKMNTDSTTDETWATWLDLHKIHVGSAKEDIVPLPSGGTFAEAILGRSNCAEKLDITRFWNWQDSPIPLQPTEIAAINTGSRATAEDVKPGQLSNPIINITAPTSLPDPSGTAAILAAIQNGNMFRDMSGLQGTIGLAQAALQATSAGAATAGQQAGTNMNSLLQANTERQRIAAEMITSLAKTAASAYTGGLAGGGGGGISGGGNHSQDGAKINYFDKTQVQTPAGTGSGGGGPTPATGGGGHSGGGGSTGGGGPSGGGGSAGDGFSQNPAALAAVWRGDNQPPSALFDRVLDRVPDAGAGDAGGGPLAFDGGTVAPPVGPFPAAADPLTADAKLRTALNKAITKVEASRSMAPGSLAVPFSFVEVTAGSGSLPFAGYRENEVDYVASEAKVAVMYAAYALRDMARRFAEVTAPKSPDELFAHLEAQMNPAIRSAIPLIASASNISDTHRLPNYRAALKATIGGGGKLDIQFSDTFDQALEKMIVPSDNNAAATCVHGVGYGYLNGALAGGGFFDIATNSGLWVAGDFQGGTAWPYVRIQSVNDQLVAQAGSARHMARLVSLVKTGAAIDQPSSSEMLGRLFHAAHAQPGMAFDQPWADRPVPRILKQNCITHNKLGLGPLKAGGEVRSEVSVLTDPIAPGRAYVVAWQNLKDFNPLGFAEIAKIIRDTITEYEV